MPYSIATSNPSRAIPAPLTPSAICSLRLAVGGARARVRLETDPRPRLGGPQPLVEGDGRLAVGAALHVEPQVRARRGGVLGDPDEMGEAGLRVEVQAELGWLEGVLRGDPGGDDLV